MADKNTLAFPVDPSAFANGNAFQGSFGMTLRDYFAAAALNGILSLNARLPDSSVADWAYSAADAMMKERDKEETDIHPAWHDEPTCAGVWVADDGGSVSATTLNNSEIQHWEATEGCDWYGPLPERK
jgi:hypothetical protein